MRILRRHTRNEGKKAWARHQTAHLEKVRNMPRRKPGLVANALKCCQEIICTSKASQIPKTRSAWGQDCQSIQTTGNGKKRNRQIVVAYLRDAKETQQVGHLQWHLGIRTAYHTGDDFGVVPEYVFQCWKKREKNRSTVNGDDKIRRKVNEPAVERVHNWSMCVCVRECVRKEREREKEKWHRKSLQLGHRMRMMDWNEMI